MKKENSGVTLFGIFARAFSLGECKWCGWRNYIANKELYLCGKCELVRKEVEKNGRRE